MKTYAKPRVTKKLAKERKRLIEEEQERISSARLERFIGREVEILVEEEVEGSALSLGRAWMQASDVDGLTVVKASFKPGTLVLARVIAVNGVDLEAEPMEPDA